MVVFAFAALLGLLGGFMRPLIFFAASVPVLVAATLALALTNGFSWLATAAAFYGSLAVAELCFVGVVSVRHWPRRVAGG